MGSFSFNQKKNSFKHELSTGENIPSVEGKELAGLVLGARQLTALGVQRRHSHDVISQEVCFLQKLRLTL